MHCTHISVDGCTGNSIRIGLSPLFSTRKGLVIWCYLLMLRKRPPSVVDTLHERAKG